MKFLVDMGISPKSVFYLRQLQHEAVHLHELGLDRLSDVDILMKAYRESFVILTHDLDFGDLLAASALELPSVVIFRLQNMSSSNVNLHLDKILAKHILDLESGAILSVSEKDVRVRRLPLQKLV
jgi:predicted nuclease of predicted toxin-antitoxin system